MKLTLVLTLLTQLQAGAVSQDSVERVRRTARQAEANFERLARRLAPIKLGGVDGRRCDEIVGRFCLVYDSGRLPEPEPEPGRVTDARREAIEALRHAFSYLPADFATAAPLIRYLVEDGRGAEAASAARLYYLESNDSIWGPLLLGFALHAVPDDSASERWFAEGLARLPADSVRRFHDVEWLLGSADRGRYDDLDAAARGAFEARLWALSDPLYLTPGNERRNEHLARHVWSRVLARAPVVMDMLRWGSDLEQLTIRYGIPTSRTRSPSWGIERGGITEHYHPDQLAYVPEDLLTKGVAPTPLPDEPWPLAETRSRSGYAPATMRRLRFLPHQVSRFPTAHGATLRVDGLFAQDSARTPTGPVLGGLFIADSVGTLRSEQRRAFAALADTLTFGFEATLGAGDYIYSLEALDSAGLASRARYGVSIESHAAGELLLSDPVLLRPLGGADPPASREGSAFRPLGSLRFAAGDTVGIYAEVHGLGRAAAAFDVEISIAPASRASLPARIASWLGDRLGLSSPDGPARLRWTMAANRDDSATLAVDLVLDGVDDGNHVIILRIADPATGRSAESRRIIRITG